MECYKSKIADEPIGSVNWHKSMKTHAPNVGSIDAPLGTIVYSNDTPCI